MDVPAGSVIAPILLDAPQNIEATLSVRFEKVPEETLIAGPATGTAVEYPQGDGTSNYQAAPLLLPGDLAPGDYSATFTHAALGKPIRVPYRVVGAAPSVVTFPAVLAAVETLMRPRLRAGNFESGGSAAGNVGAVAHFQDNPPTRPALSTATEAVARHTAEAVADYSGAEEEDAPAIVTVAALRAAIELESSHYPEQITAERSPASFWLKLLERYEGRLGRESEAEPGEDGGGPGLDPVWYFGPPSPIQYIAEGAEAPLLPVVRPIGRRRVW